MSHDRVCTEFSSRDVKGMEPEMKVGLLATANSDGLPHLTLISSLRASSSKELIFGQFVEGLSKQFIRENPRVGFLVMTLDKEIWRGKAVFTKTATQGPEFEMYNNTPMFRYNAYFGVHTVYYMDLVEHVGGQKLPMGRIVLAAVQTMIARTLWNRPEQQAALNSWTRRLMNKLDNLKYLAYIGGDGFPVIVPVIQAQAVDSEHVIFSAGVYRRDLEAIPVGATVAVFGMSLEMEDVLLRGIFQGLGRIGGVRAGMVAVDWVYNPMPPTPRQIYPRLGLQPVTRFEMNAPTG